MAWIVSYNLLNFTFFSPKSFLWLKYLNDFIHSCGEVQMIKRKWLDKIYYHLGKYEAISAKTLKIGRANNLFYINGEAIAKHKSTSIATNVPCVESLNFLDAIASLD